MWVVGRAFELWGCLSCEREALFVGGFVCVLTAAETCVVMYVCTQLLVGARMVRIRV